MASRARQPVRANAAPDGFVPSPGAADGIKRQQLLEAIARAGTPYYDEKADRARQAEYYRDIDPSASLYGQLHELVSRTHTEWLDYDAARYLYPWVDLRPGMRLQSVYSPREVTTGDPLHRPNHSPRYHKKSRNQVERMQARVVRRAKHYAEGEEWKKALMSAPLNAPELAARIALLEAGNYFNCEHAVPQVLYERDPLMRGDLHQLFASERDINSVRSNLPLRDFPEYDGTPIPGSEREGYARPDGFEPAGGKGPMARAVMYFMLRYPWVLKRAGELGYNHEQLQTLLQWHREDPPGLYEQHRNAEIEKLQGNRNPLIDHPEWAFMLDFSAALVDR